jgi:ribosomal protein S3AE
MQKLDIDEVKPSMILAATVKDKDGNILFLKGVELTERHIIILNNRDIKKVVVEGCPVKRETCAAKGFFEEIDRRFSTAGSHPMVLKIKDIIKELLF